MERRDGPAYAFCDPLLESALPSVADGQVRVCVFVCVCVCLRERECLFV